MSTKGLNPESADKYRAFFARTESSPDYWMGVPIAELTEDICRLMEEKQISRAELARRLGTSRAYVTKLLDGNANFTLATMVKLAMALDGALHLHIADRRAATRWYDEMPADGKTVETEVPGAGAQQPSRKRDTKTRV